MEINTARGWVKINRKPIGGRKLNNLKKISFSTYPKEPISEDGLSRLILTRDLLSFSLRSILSVTTQSGRANWIFSLQRHLFFLLFGSAKYRDEWHCYGNYHPCWYNSQLHLGNPIETIKVLVTSNLCISGRYWSHAWFLIYIYAMRNAIDDFFIQKPSNWKRASLTSEEARILLEKVLEFIHNNSESWDEDKSQTSLSIYGAIIK